jgi:hypothetical protein
MADKKTKAELSIDEQKEFCQEYVNGLPQGGREEIFDILRLHVDDIHIDSGNSDGSRIYWSHIPDAAWTKMYRAIRVWLES